MGFSLKRFVKNPGHELRRNGGNALGKVFPVAKIANIPGQNLANKAMGKSPQPEPTISPNGTPQFGMRNTSEFIKEQPSIKIGGQDAISRRFSLLKENAKAQNDAFKTDQSNAISRRFASTGNSGSGAESRVQRKAALDAEKLNNENLNQIGAQEQAEFSNRELAQADMDFKNRVFAFESGSKLHELDLAERQFQVDQSTTDFNKQLAAKNMEPKKKGFLGEIFDGIF